MTEKSFNPLLHPQQSWEDKSQLRWAEVRSQDLGLQPAWSNRPPFRAPPKGGQLGIDPAKGQLIVRWMEPLWAAATAKLLSQQLARGG